MLSLRKTAIRPNSAPASASMRAASDAGDPRSSAAAAEDFWICFQTFSARSSASPASLNWRRRVTSERAGLQKPDGFIQSGCGRRCGKFGGEITPAHGLARTIHGVHTSPMLALPSTRKTTDLGRLSRRIETTEAPASIQRTVDQRPQPHAKEEQGDFSRNLYPSCSAKPCTPSKRR